MKAHYNNYLLSSTILWIDNYLCNECRGFYNVSTRFYPIASNLSGVSFYASPYKQLVYDNSVSGANVLTGIYVNNNFIGTGVSGFQGINFEEGVAMFSPALPSSAIVSGHNYSVKEICVKSISEAREELLYESKFYYRNRPLNTGNYIHQQPIPIIYVRIDNELNEEFAFGGSENSKKNIILTILAENQFQLDALKGFLVDKTHNYIPILSLSDLPFDNFYRLKSGFNYTGVLPKIGMGEGAYIADVSVYNFDSNVMSELRKINSDIYSSIINIETHKVRSPKSDN